MSLKDISAHFTFGENWSHYAATIDEARLAEAEKGLVRLLGEEPLAGKSLLDIGCGSGVHDVAALRLGAARVVAIDIDPVSVSTARSVATRHAPGRDIEVKELSVFDLAPETFGTFDIVYSWGVLHHTGAMIEAVGKAAQVVKPGGLFVFALYHRTALCGLWRVEKRWYTNASERMQRAARLIYIGLLRLRFKLSGRDFGAYVANYKSSRGMNFGHDVHDWMGGYPYESILAPEVETLMVQLGFEHVRSFTSPKTLGFFGSGCDEYVYRRR
ncbi:MAG: class I SAM-dependent methyltransferase [Proteobacteria bacterium]|nr:class I SAM-dependent methyltransferase [Pseudomonadota bacterium]